jgi:hypothetical protein
MEPQVLLPMVMLMEGGCQCKYSYLADWSSKGAVNGKNK